MPWKKLLACVTGQINEALRQKLKYVLEENRQHEAGSLYLRNPPRWEPKRPVGVQYLIFDLQQNLQQINTEK